MNIPDTVAATPKDETLKDEGFKSQKLVKRRDEPQPEKLIVRKTKDEDEGADDAKSKLAPCHTYGCGMGRNCISSCISSCWRALPCRQPTIEARRDDGDRPID